MLLEPREEIIHHCGEVSRHLDPLLWILVYVEQHDGFQWVQFGGARLGAVVAGPGEPHATAWRKKDEGH